ncbi:TraB/GumN family protein [Lysobacter brunescens]|uniref:TraB/GumN family protein n=1 Tax=Lysobacter brunescens TaxID=262323 RepID=A0ABW2YH36_9GAMM
MTPRPLAMLAACLLAVTCASPVLAQTPPPEPVGEDGELKTSADDPSLQSLEAIVVSGRQPGPGLWKVTRGGNVMWILGTQSPLPKRMDWDTAQVERRLSESQELLLPASVSLDADVGFFKGLLLLPSLLKARKNPDEKTLSDIIPPAQYARWQVLKQRYIGSDKGVEEMRPLFAAMELYGKAINRSGLTLDSVISETVTKLARRHDVKTTDPKVVIKIENPKVLLKEFQRTTLDDTACFERTLSRIEGDLGLMTTRANAWAQGDVEALRDLQARNTQWAACRDAFTNSALARKAGITDMEARVRKSWLDAAEAALARNRSTFALLSTADLLSPDGYLAALAAKGYMVEEP